MPNTLTVASFNANSIRVRLEQVLRWLARVHPDVLAIQETKCADEAFPAEPIRAAGYHVVYRGSGGYAGVALLSREEPEDVAFGLDDDDEPDGHRLVRAHVHGIDIVNTYIPQGREITSEVFHYKLRWFARLRCLFERHYHPAQPLIWLGDLNVAPEPIDVHDPKRHANHVDYHPEVRAAFQQTVSWGFEDVFRRLHPDEPEQYTYWDYRVRNPVANNAGWRIDHIMATPPLAAVATKAWIDVDERLAARPSDHTFLTAQFDMTRLRRL
ncbi:MAG TPA: exodeoxyribonuclease III [Chloroflexi bacterium]|jgi:exodeoxyribonuclease-3|nr:exodeoxyribonuclease III [Chloroflexota bacterium]